MNKFGVILILIMAFVVDTTVKSVCAYNNKIIRTQKATNLSLTEEQLGDVSIKFYGTLGCNGMDKPFVYTNQLNALWKFTSDTIDMFDIKQDKPQIEFDINENTLSD